MRDSDVRSYRYREKAIESDLQCFNIGSLMNRYGVRVCPEVWSQSVSSESWERRQSKEGESRESKEGERRLAARRRSGPTLLIGELAEGECRGDWAKEGRRDDRIKTGEGK